VSIIEHDVEAVNRTYLPIRAEAQAWVAGRTRPAFQTLYRSQSLKSRLRQYLAWRSASVVAGRPLAKQR
jgi:hypothetical protein